MKYQILLSALCLTAHLGALGTASAQAAMTGRVSPCDGTACPLGRHRYDFTLTAVGPTIPCVGWVVFADAGGSSSRPRDAATLTRATLIGRTPAPWTHLGSSSGGHSGPTLQPVSGSSCWSATSIGGTAEWSVHATNLVDGSGTSRLYWSNLTGTGPRANYLPITMDSGSPTVRFTAPESVMEGEAFTVEVAVMDPAGDPVTWAWDTDEDDMFTELMGATSYEVMAGTTDGDSVMRLSVEASDGMETSRATVDIMITNVPPSFSSTPESMARVLHPYRYTPEVTDPAGTLDPIEFEILSGPDGLVVGDGGTLTWTPDAEARGMSFPVELVARDGDGGTATQSWTIEVLSNQAPTAPIPLSPIDREMVTTDGLVPLVVGNASDPDGDTLQYYFRLDQASSFDSALLFESPVVPEGDGGMTTWSSPRTLNVGLWYWEAWAHDGIDESPRAFGQFIVTMAQPDAAVPMGTADGGDSGTPRGDGGPGPTVAPPTNEATCACSAPGGASASTPLWLSFAFAILFWRRRH